MNLAQDPFLASDDIAAEEPSSDGQAGSHITFTTATPAVPPACDFVTILTSKGPLLTKQWHRDRSGNLQCENYEHAKHFKVEQKPIAGVDELLSIIQEIGPRSCVILGRLKAGVDPTNALRLLKDRPLANGMVDPATIEDAMHCWLPIDVDSVEARDKDGEFDPLTDPTRAIFCVLEHLPEEFIGADCLWQFTSSAGLKPGIRMRLYFWLSRPLTGVEMKAWLGSCKAVDPSIYGPNQLIYAAPPVLDGVADPVRKRTGIIRSSGPVAVPEAIPTRPQQKASSGSSADVQDGPSRASKGQPVSGPEDVDYDDPETIAWATELIKEDLAANGRPKIGQGSDNRTYALIGKLRDGRAWGKSLEPETIADLLKEHWAPHFDDSWLLKKANGSYQNDPGVGPAGASRLYGASADYAPTGPLTAGIDDPFAGVAIPAASDGASTTTPLPASTLPQLPPLGLGSDVEIAKSVARYLQQLRGEVVFDEGHLWFYDTTHWRPIEEHELRRMVHTYDGAVVAGSSNRVKLGKTRIDSVLNEMRAILARPDFFAGAAVGINCAAGFITFSRDGEPSLVPHDPAHRCRHVLKGGWSDGTITDAEELFLIFKLLGVSLLARLLEGLFRGDEDAGDKRQLLAEIAGAAALGYGTKLRQPKAVILEGKTAENGKSQVLDLFRGLLPSEAVASIPAAKMGDERFVIDLVGKHLNASDELSGAEAIAGDVFKSAITGEPITARCTAHR
jgi:hypothetical protein